MAQSSLQFRVLEEIAFSFKKMFNYLNEKGERDAAINGSSQDSMSQQSRSVFVDSLTKLNVVYYDYKLIFTALQDEYFERKISRRYTDLQIDRYTK
jgi:hypothetical protein